MAFLRCMIPAVRSPQKHYVSIRYGSDTLYIAGSGKDMSLADFATWYRLSYSVSTLEDEADETVAQDAEPESITEEALPHVLSLESGTVLQKRTKQAVLRYAHFNMERQPEKYYRSKLMLFLPWRNEQADLQGEYSTFEEQYKAVAGTIRTAEAHYTIRSDEVDTALEDLQMHGAPEHAWPALAPSTDDAMNTEQGQEERTMDPEDLSNERMLSGNYPTATHASFTSQRDPTLLETGKYKSMMRSLNLGQRTAVTKHRMWCKSAVSCMKQGKPVVPYQLFISGPGGVGKSHIIKLIQNDTIQILKKSSFFEPDNVVILLTAPTGTAAYNINGMTIHSALSFSPFMECTAYKLNSMRTSLHHLQVLIIDEVSMVGADFFTKISERLKLVKQNAALFGNVTVILVGDLYQLKPVRENYIFGASANTMNNVVCPDTLLSSFSVLHLNEVMRQKDDQPFAEMLCRVRTGHATAEDLEELVSREISPTDPNYPHMALHTFTTNKKVDAHNNALLHKMEREVYTISANDSKRDVETGQIEDAQPDSRSRNETGNLPSTLSICVGARVMLTSNIDVSDGLSNGSTGTVTAVIVHDSSVLVVLVEFDHPQTGRHALLSSQYRKRYPRSVPIKREETRFAAGKSRRQAGRGKSVTIRRRQFPLVLAWACTIHKTQGMTVDQIVVDFSGRFEAGQAYVALSRVKTKDGLFVRSFDATKITVNPAVSDALSALPSMALDYPIVPSSDSLCIAHLNVRGYTCNMDDICAHPDISSLQLFCITETHLHPSMDNTALSFPWSTAQVLRQDRDQRGGGVLLCWPESSHIQIRSIPCDAGTALESLSVKLCFPCSGTLYVTTVYRCSGNSKTVCEELSHIIAQVPSSAAFLLLGDFNEDISSLTSSKPIHDFLLLPTEGSIR